MSFLVETWQDLHLLWRYRWMVAGAVWRELRAQSLGSLMGVAWLLVQPVAMVAVYTLVFSRVMGARLPGALPGGFDYSVYLCAGLLPWQWWAEGLQRLHSVFVRHGNLIKKAAFPRMTLVAVELGIASANFVLVAGVFMVFWLTVSEALTGWTVLVVIPALLVQLLLLVGLGVTLAILHVFFRDVGQLLAMGLMFWFWLTPIVYVLEVLPAWAQRWIWWNPMTTLVHFYQLGLYWGRWPLAEDWLRLALWAVAGAALLASATRLYRMRSAELADEL